MLSHARVRAWHEWKVKQLAFRDYARRENVRRYNRQRGFIINPYAFGGAATDPYFANVVSLAHWDGTNTDTGPFDDVVRGAGAWTRNSLGAQLSSGTVKYGSTSLNCGSVGVFNPDHADWDFGSGDFTLEAWVNIANTTNPGAQSQVVWFKREGSGFAPWLIYITASTTYPQLFCSTSGSAWDASVAQTSVSISTNTWYFLLGHRDGTNLRLFLDGTQIGSTATLSGSLMSSSDDVGIGSDAGNTLFAMNGFIDDTRATKGVARSGATVPVAAFPDS